MKTMYTNEMLTHDEVVEELRREATFWLDIISNAHKNMHPIALDMIENIKEGSTFVTIPSNYIIPHFIHAFVVDGYLDVVIAKDMPGAEMDPFENYITGASSEERIAA